MPAPAQMDPMPMELNSQHRRISQQEHNQCIREALCFVCKEHGHVSRKCPKRRVRILGAEVAMKQGTQIQSSGNEDTQE